VSYKKKGNQSPSWHYIVHALPSGRSWWINLLVKQQPLLEQTPHCASTAMLILE
jgi:hypothetical protein